MANAFERGISIRLINEDESEWYDIGLKQTVRGRTYVYRVDHDKSGTWCIDVNIAQNVGKATVVPKKCDGTTITHNQLLRKSIVFNECNNRPSYYYHPLGIEYSMGDRIHAKRISEKDEIPEDISQICRIEKYENVALGQTRALVGKLVAIVGRAEPEKMARIFVLEKIVPLFPRRFTYMKEV